MSNIKILVAEDDANIRAGLVDTLMSEGYEVDAAHDGGDALEIFLSGKFHLVILDVMMPAKSGYDVLREIRAAGSAVPVIMLTAKAEEIDKVVGLELGADDYVTKPFGVRELLARIAAVLRRSYKEQGPREPDLPEEFSFGRAKIDARRFRGSLGGRSFDLSAKEMKLLAFFFRHPGEVLSRDRLLNEVWGVDYFGTTRTLDQHISQLRKKIEADPKSPETITTIHGVGYRYEK